MKCGKYSTGGLTAWPEAVPRTGLGAGVGRAGGAAAARTRLQLLHSVPQWTLLHVTAIRNKDTLTSSVESNGDIVHCRISQSHLI